MTHASGLMTNMFRFIFVLDEIKYEYNTRISLFGYIYMCTYNQQTSEGFVCSP